MNIHEYQAKSILRKFNVNVPVGYLIESKEQAIDAAKNVVSLKGPQGNIFKVKVQNPDLMKDIAVNDQVKVVYTEAIAAVVSTPAKK